MKIPKGTFSGCHPALGNRNEADARFAFEFSHRPENETPGQPNIEIAQFLHTANIEMPLPVFASMSIVRALDHIRSDVQVLEPFKGPSAHGTKENTGTWGELTQALYFIFDHSFEHPEFITSGYNIGNVVMQANKMGIKPIVPGNLSRSFDPKSDQLWTRNRLWWSVLAYPRLLKIRSAGH